MPRGAEEEAERGAEAPVEWKVGVCREAGEEGAGMLAIERGLGQPSRGANRTQPEAGKRDGVAGRTQGRSEQLAVEPAPVTDDRPNQTLIGRAVRAQ